MTEWATYNDYLNSSIWKEKRQEALKRAGNRCQTCSSTIKIQVHHRKYSEWGKEPIEDLTALCESCHRLFTFRSPNSHVRKRFKHKHRKKQKSKYKQPKTYKDKLFKLSIDKYKSITKLIESRQRDGLEVSSLLPKQNYWRLKLPPDYLK